MTDRTFVIEHLWINERANNVTDSCGYVPIGFAESRKEAEDIVTKGGQYPGSPAFFFVPPGAPYFRYRELPKLDAGTITPGPHRLSFELHH